MAHKRDDFSEATKLLLAKRVGFRCSNPKCRKHTSGSNADPNKATNIGVAAHICAAAIGGPRYNPKMTTKERKSPHNGIWLCQSCSKLIDADPLCYSKEKLEKWKYTAEETSRQELECLCEGNLNVNGKLQCVTCDVLGKYFSSTDRFTCKDGVHATNLSKYFDDNPLSFKTADDTVYSGHEVLKGNVTLERFDQSRITVFNWAEFSTDITKEAKNAPKGKITVQAALKEYLSQNGQYSHIIYDHGAGETADYLTFRTDGTFIKVELYHCKAMKGKNYNSSVEDVYEVAQQAIKSTVWIKSKTALLNKMQSRIKGGRTDKFIRGDIRTLKSLLQSQKAMETTIYIVQPAVSKTKAMSEPFGKVLSAAAFYIKNTGRAKELGIIGSQ